MTVDEIVLCPSCGTKNRISSGKSGVAKCGRCGNVLTPTFHETKERSGQSRRPRSVAISEIMQIVLAAEPFTRVDYGSVVSIVGTSLFFGVAVAIILQATRRRRNWARNWLGGLAVLALLFPVYLFVTGGADYIFLRATVGIVLNFIAVALLFTPSADKWFPQMDEDRRG